MAAEITVVVPVYNAGKLITNCIESVLRQTNPDWKLILVDDGSKDKSSAICDRYAEKDNRIQVIHQHNQGCVNARKNGVSAVETEYCCFLDADDTLPENALKVLMDCIPESDKSAIIIGKTVRTVRGIKIKSKYNAPCFSSNSKAEYSQKEFIEQLYCSWFGKTNVPVSLWGKVYPTSMLKKTFDDVPNIVRFMGEDLIMTLDIMPKADKTIIIPDVVYNYRVGGGTSKYQPELMNDWLSLYRFKKGYADRYPMPQNIQKMMDVELINMTFTYFSMLSDYHKLTDEIILEVCQINEVVQAASNPELSPSSLKAKAVRENNIPQIRQILKKSLKQKAYDAMKKVLYKLA
ncbi:MAG: glycosyltransferase [Lachnospiraceae bacterium]|nr:glycosyltransferase [Lachnospiraceae bacterium]